MPKRTHAEKDEVLRQAFVFFLSHARHNLSPTSRNWSQRLAGECLWALGIEEYEGHKAKAPVPVGDTIEGVATRLVQDGGISS